MPERLRIKLRRSPNTAKKWRVELLATGKHVDFGQSGASDFTIHKDPPRMIRYLVRHSADIPNTLKVQGKKANLSREEKSRIISQALNVRKSRREKWGDTDLDSAVHSAGFWSRWLLWSLPDLKQAKFFISKRFNIEFV